MVLCAPTVKATIIPDRHLGLHHWIHHDVHCGRKNADLGQFTRWSQSESHPNNTIQHAGSLYKGAGYVPKPPC